jgi:hypothetical protein
VTFTLPRDRRARAFAHQRFVYGVLIRSAAAAGCARHESFFR